MTNDAEESGLSRPARVALSAGLGVILMIFGYSKAREDPLLGDLKARGVQSICEPRFERTKMTFSLRRGTNTKTFLRCEYSTTSGPMTGEFQVHFDVERLQRQLELAQDFAEIPFVAGSTRGSSVAAKRVSQAAQEYADQLRITYLPENPRLAAIGTLDQSAPSVFNFTFIAGLVLVGIAALFATRAKGDDD